MNTLGGDPQLWPCLTDIGHPSWTISVPNGAEALCPVFAPPSPSVSEIYQGLNDASRVMFPLSLLHNKSLGYQSPSSESAPPGIWASKSTQDLIRYGFLLKTRWRHFINMITQHLIPQPLPYWHACPISQKTIHHIHKVYSKSSFGSSCWLW